MTIITKNEQIICNFDNAIGTKISNTGLIIELDNENIYFYCDIKDDAYSLRNKIFAAADRNRKFYVLNPRYDKYYQIKKEEKIYG